MAAFDTPTALLDQPDATLPESTSETALGEYAPQLRSPNLETQAARVESEVGLFARPAWYPQARVSGDRIEWAPDYDVNLWKERLSPMELAELKQDTTGEVLRSKLTKEQEMFARLDRGIATFGDVTEALRRDDELISFVVRRGLKKEILGDQTLGDALWGLTKSIAKGGVTYGKVLGGEVKTTETPGGARPSYTSRKIDTEKLSALNVETAAQVKEGWAAISHGVKAMKWKAAGRLAEALDRVTPEQRAAFAEVAEAQLLKAQLEIAGRDQVRQAALSDFSKLAEQDIRDAGMFGSLFADPTNFLPVGAAVKAGAKALSVSKLAAAFRPGLTEGLKLELSAITKARVLADVAEAATKSSAEATVGMGDSLAVDLYQEAATKAAELRVKEAKVQAAFAASAASDDAALVTAGKQSLSRYAAASALETSGRVVEKAGEWAQSLSDKLDNLAAFAGSGDKAFAATVRGGVGAGVGYVINRSASEDDSGLLGAGLGFFAGSAGTAKFATRAGAGVRTMGEIIRVGETTQSFARKFAQETGSTGLAKFIADRLDPSTSTNLLVRGASAVGRGVVDTAAGGLRGVAAAAPIGAGFGYVASGGDTEEALNQGLAFAPIGFMGGALGSLTPMARAGDDLRRAEANRQYLKRRWQGTENESRFNRLTPEQQLITANFAHANPDLALVLIGDNAADDALIKLGMKSAKDVSQLPGGVFEVEVSKGQMKTFLAINPNKPKSVFAATMAHELRHLIQRDPDIQNSITTELIGDPETGVPGRFTALDENGAPIKQVVNGREVFATTKEFQDLKAGYEESARQTLQADYSISDEKFALEYDAEATAYSWLDGDFSEAVRPTFSGVLTGKLQDSKFLRSTLAKFGYAFDRKLAFSPILGRLPLTPETRRLAKQYTDQWARNGIETGEAGPGVKLDLAQHPQLVEMLRNSAEINWGAGGIPEGMVVENGQLKIVQPEKVFKSVKQIEKDLAEMREVVEAAVREAPASVDDVDAVKVRREADGSEVMAGRYFTDTQIDRIEASGRFNPYQLETLKNVNAMMKAGGGNFLRMFYQAALERGRYKSIRGHWVEEVPYGWLVTKKDNIVIRTVSPDKVIRNLEGLWAKENHDARRLWGTTADMVNDAFTYLDNLSAERPGDTGLNESKRNFLNVALGINTKRRGEVNPMFSPTLSRKLESFIVSRRLDRTNRVQPGLRDKVLPWSHESYARGRENLRPEGILRRLDEDDVQLRPEGNPETQRVAEDYVRKAFGHDYTNRHEDYVTLPEEEIRRIADYFENSAKHAPEDPEVRASYDALIRETKAQYEAMVAAGVEIEPFSGKGEPYKSSAEMMQDVAENRHLTFFLTDSGFGSDGKPMVHPLLEPSGIKIGDRELLNNDLFRAVHDYFGHTQQGYQFGPRGEFNAWQSHSRMFSDEAQGALAAETLTQNAWVNFGPHLRDPEGKVPAKGQPGYVPPAERPFADQRAFVLPREFIDSVQTEPVETASPNVQYRVDVPTKKAIEDQISGWQLKKSEAEAYRSYWEDQRTLDKETLPAELQLDKEGRPKFDEDDEGKVQVKTSATNYNFIRAPEVQRLRDKYEGEYRDKLAELTSKRSAAPRDEKPKWEERIQTLKTEWQETGQNRWVEEGTDLASDRLFEEAEKALANPEVAAGRGWYSRMRLWLQQRFGAGIEEFAQLLGATSARTPVDENFKQALDGLARLSQGVYDPLLQRFHEHVEAARTAHPDDPDAFRKEVMKFDEVPLRSNGKKFNANSDKVLHAMYGVWLEITQGPKTPNFAGNLSGRSTKATIDVWAARTLHRLLYQGQEYNPETGRVSRKANRWRLQPVAESSVEHLRKLGSETGGDFFFAQKAYEKAAERLGMSGDDLQALLWFHEKDLWGKMDWTRDARAKKKSSFDEEAAKIDTDRFQAGVTTFTTKDEFNPAVFEKTLQETRETLAAMPSLRYARAQSTSGLYGDVIEPSFDVEIVVDRGTDISPVLRKVIEIGKAANQTDVFISRIVAPDHPNARPGLEIGFKTFESSEFVDTLVASLRQAGMDGFTVAVDRRNRPIGLRAQFVPEFMARWLKDDPPALVDFIQGKRVEEASDKWQQNTRQALENLHPEVRARLSYHNETHFDTRVFGREEYDSSLSTQWGETELSQELGRRLQILRR